MVSGLALAVALSAAWAPTAKFSLVCTGTQTGYQELGGSRVSLPWSEMFTVDLAKGVYCSQPCRTSQPIANISATGLDLDKISVPGVLRTKHFDPASRSYASAEADGQSNDRFRIEKSGTCIIKP